MYACPALQVIEPLGRVTIIRGKTLARYLSLGSESLPEPGKATPLLAPTCVRASWPSFFFWVGPAAASLLGGGSTASGDGEAGPPWGSSGSADFGGLSLLRLACSERRRSWFRFCMCGMSSRGEADGSWTPTKGVLPLSSYCRLSGSLAPPGCVSPSLAYGKSSRCSCGGPGNEDLELLAAS